MMKATLLMILVVMAAPTNILGLQCRECVSLTGDMINDCIHLAPTPSPKIPKNNMNNHKTTGQNEVVLGSEEGQNGSNEGTDVIPINQDPITVCVKNTFYLRRGNRVGRIISLFGLSNNATSGSENDSTTPTSVESQSQEMVFDGECFYTNGENPRIDQAAAFLKLEPYTFLVGVKTCYCATDFCNGDPLMRK